MAKVKWTMPTVTSTQVVGLKTRRLAKVYTCLITETDMRLDVPISFATILPAGET